MKNMTETISRYVSAWNERAPESIKAALMECCIAGIIYTDKNTPTYTDKQTPVIEGIEALTALILSSNEKIPGRTFSLLTTPQYFNRHCHYSWGLHIPGKAVMAGWDYIRYNGENQIEQIIGFLPEQP